MPEVVIVVAYKMTFFFLTSTRHNTSKLQYIHNNDDTAIEIDHSSRDLRWLYKFLMSLLTL